MSVLILILSSELSMAQISNDKKAEIYFKEAKKHYGQKEYQDALFFINKIQSQLRITNATILDLKIKTHYELNQFGLAKKAWSCYVNNYLGTVSESLEDQTLSYLAPIEKGIKDSVEVEKSIIAQNSKKLKELIESVKLKTCYLGMKRGRCPLTQMYYLRNNLWVKEKISSCEKVIIKSQLNYFKPKALSL